MENGPMPWIQPGKMVVHLAPRRLRRPRSPEQEKIYQRLLALRTSNPELFRSEIARLEELSRLRSKVKPIPLDPPEIREQRRAARLEKYGPFKSSFAPFFLTDLYEATCVTRYVDERYKMLANLDPRETIFKVVNRVTGLVDEEFTSRIIKRYREDPGESSATAVAASGIADEVREGISVLKLRHCELGESSKTVVTASGTADEELAASVPKRHCKQDLGKSSETVITASRNN